MGGRDQLGVEAAGRSAVIAPLLAGVVDALRICVIAAAIVPR